MIKDKVVINGGFFTFDDFVSVIFDGAKIEVSNNVYEALKHVREKLNRELESGKIIYGVNTGFGALANKRIKKSEVNKLQVNLLRSHSVGIGEYVNDEIARGTLLLRIVSLSKGHSGIRPQLLRLLVEFFNSGAVPLIPSRGSVGASGDLSPLSHLALAVIGDHDGVVKFLGKVYRGSGLVKLLKEYIYRDLFLEEEFREIFGEGFPLVKLSYKEGLALNNGTAFSASILAYAIYKLEKLIDIADLNLALALECLSGFVEPFDERFFELGDPGYEHPGSRTVIHVRGLLSDNGDHLHSEYDKYFPLSIFVEGITVKDEHKIVEIKLDNKKLVKKGIKSSLNQLIELMSKSLREIELEYLGLRGTTALYLSSGNINNEDIERALDNVKFSLPEIGLVQDSYSLRCAPQVHGSVRRAVDIAKLIFNDEVNLPNDNPLFFVEGDELRVLSGGNFHGQSISLASDILAIGIATLGNISERRIFKMLDPNINKGLPPFLANDPGLNSGFMIAQYLAAELTAELRQLSTPLSVHSIPTSANQEDLVSMSATGALRLLKMIDLLEGILSIEFLVALQGSILRFLGNEVGDHVKGVSGIVEKAYDFIKGILGDELNFPIKEDTVLSNYINIVKENIYRLHDVFF